MKTNHHYALKQEIGLLKIRQLEELEQLKAQLQEVRESLRPVNFLKNTLQEVRSSSDLKDDILNNVIGLSTGYLSKKIMVGSSHNPVKKILGTFLQFAIANVVTKHSESIKALVNKGLEKLMNKIQASKDERPARHYL